MSNTADDRFWERWSDLDGIAEEEKQRFEIKNDGSAEWAIKKILKAQAERDRRNAACQAEIERLSASMADNDKWYETETSFFYEHLRGYFETVEHKVAKTQEKYWLPSADLILKQPEPKYERENDLIVDYLRDTAQDEFIKTTVEPDWAGLKKQTKLGQGNSVIDTSTGALIPGVVAVPREPIFEIRAR